MQFKKAVGDFFARASARVTDAVTAAQPSIDNAVKTGAAMAGDAVKVAGQVALAARRRVGEVVESLNDDSRFNTEHDNRGSVGHARGRGRSHDGRPRLYAERELSLARAYKAGFFKAYTGEFGDEGNKVVFKVWVSPYPGHVDRRGNPVRRVFPRFIYKNGIKVTNVPFVRDEQGPYLPISLLYGLPVRLDQFPLEHREVLELFADPIAHGLKVYNAHRKARRKVKSA